MSSKHEEEGLDSNYGYLGSQAHGDAGENMAKMHGQFDSQFQFAQQFLNFGDPTGEVRSGSNN